MFENQSRKSRSHPQRNGSPRELRSSAQMTHQAQATHSFEFTGGLPKDFWPILIYTSDVVSSANETALRQTPLYQHLKQQQEAERKSSKAIESEKQLRLDTKSTSSHRP